MSQQNIRFPIILKPDRGERGWQVEKIRSEEELSRYLAKGVDQLLLQEFIPHRLEYGIMYARLPGRRKGRITSLVIEEQLSVTGDGTSTIRVISDNQNSRPH